MEFFRHCPGCGRRFHIKLETKKLVTSHQAQIPKTILTAVGRSGRSMGSFSGASLPVTVQEGRPIIVDVEEFQYMYKCAHCGHEWTERHVEEKRVA